MTQYFFIHVMLLGILTIFAGLGAACFCVAFFQDTDKNDKRKFKWAFCSFLCFLACVGGSIWWLMSANQPWQTEFTDLHDIKDVTFPDNSHVQMFTCDNVHHNVTSMFGKVVDEKEWVVRRVRWSPLYLGVSWSGQCDNLKDGDRFFLEHRAGVHPSVEIKDPVPPSTKK